MYEWDFGDGGTDIAQSNVIEHTYKKSGAQDVTLTIRGDGGESNEVTFPVYVVDTNQPFGIIEVGIDGARLTREDASCEGQPAYLVDRVSPVTFYGDASVNESGGSSDLTYFWEIGTGKRSTANQFQLRFDEVGCFPVELTVTSSETGRSHIQNTFVSVQNLPPKIGDIQVQIENLEADPLVIRVASPGSVDPDGVITSFTWYYTSDADTESQ